MKTIMVSTIALGVFAGVAALSQIQAQAPAAGGRSGPGVQSMNDPREADVLKTCKTPPPARGGGAAKGGGAKGGQAKGGPAPAAPAPMDFKVTDIPGVVVGGELWKVVWQVDGNNADGIIPTSDGGILLAQNDNSKVMKIDKTGKVSEAYTGTNTGGSVSMNSKGALFVANRGLNPSIEELAPTRKMLANKYNEDPLDCLGVVLNDITADSKGGVYFTMGTVYYADPTGKVTRYGQNLNTNGILLSPDEKHVYVTNGPSLVEFDVQMDGSLTNQRDFAKWESGGGDGSTFDSAGRFYVTTNAGGIKVIAADGKFLGTIPSPWPVLSTTISGPDRKTLYAVARVGDRDWIISLQLVAQGMKGRGK